MSFIDLVNRRRSCRAYLSQPVEREKIIACLEAARLAPSACNSQPWRFVVVDDPEKVRSLAPNVQNELIRLNLFSNQVPAFIVVVEETAKMSAKLGGLIKNQQYAQIDIGLAVQSLSLAATEQGLGTCILGWFKEEPIKKLLGIPKQKRIRLVVAIGYPAQGTAMPKVRKPSEEVYNFNQY